MAQRDEFSRETIQKLGERVRLLCSNPDCRTATKGAHTNVGKVASVGKACHIHAAAPGGPRYLASQSEDGRRSIGNGIYLCSNCATLIDSDEARFPATLLRQWKDTAETRAKQDVGKRPATVAPDPEPSVELTMEYKTLSRHPALHPTVHHYELYVVIKNVSTKRIDDWVTEVEIPTLLLEPGTNYGARVEARSNRDVTLFRRTSRALAPLEIGDCHTLNIPYRVNDEIYRNRDGRQPHVFEETITARASVGGTLVVTLERKVDHLQNF